MQLIRLNAWPASPRGNGLFVVLLEDAADRAEARVLALSEARDGSSLSAPLSDALV